MVSVVPRKPFRRSFLRERTCIFLLQRPPLFLFLFVFCTLLVRFTHVLNFHATWKEASEIQVRLDLPFAPFTSTETVHIPGTSTLGFSRIYVLNLVTRTDRRAYMETLVRSLNLDVHIVPALTPASSELLPYRHLLHERGWLNVGGYLREPELACWGSHMKIWSDVVASNLSSALVMEDDVDIEWEIEEIWAQLQKGLESTTGLDGWDIVYLGHCFNKAGPVLYRSMYTTRNGGQVVHSIREARESFCTHAYAVSHRGAMKLLRLLRDTDRSVDWALNRRRRKAHLRLLSVHTPLIIQLRKSADNPSDVHPGDMRSEERPEEELIESTASHFKL
ncbi:uncharacterized protein SPPG_06160 [Spizellomyces punctatus DAOM BR117]|uniref:Glycosyl transferase family 25 domain-containing protein n=1 Tax=Spizellomyces punctatus (strain DAOM BR117) TaxID=645134 RepID=A0A0L0HA71_SPIPD|nr:uncharacterized protein SPPG_06160 [Spizellomyces punctatus DAOM BR117]KNC98460.1 hypothetical protein SPPG_06160 [Spizellomyces punctatus DAOM BR117]|eukprot:XP_016606500.1 hypothetical protein SPPG_06160 [Spizellomyces punctatus DAOM BR117]